MAHGIRNDNLYRTVSNSSPPLWAGHTAQPMNCHETQTQVGVSKANHKGILAVNLTANTVSEANDEDN